MKYSQNATIFVVEDDDNIRPLLNFMLTREGYHVLEAADGREASNLISSAPPPNLVLLDIMLPYVDGFQLYKMIRAKPEWNEVPVIMLTAKSQAQDVIKALESGVIDYVTKPFQPEVLIARVRRFLATHTTA